MYNIEVEGTHTYFANGIAVSNCHRAGSDSFIDHVFRTYPNAIIIGWTATPWRLDGRPLGGELFDKLEVLATYETLLKRPDWLVAPDAFSVPIRPDLSQVRTAGSDFDEEMLAVAMHTDVLEGQIVDHWLRLSGRHPKINGSGVREPGVFVEGERRRTIGFFVNIAHSMSVAAKFEKASVKVAHLDSNTLSETRKAIWRDLASGALEVVCNCNIAIEGVDVPEVKCVTHARPTQSITLWRQSNGRCMRPWNNVVPLLLDHAGNWDRLGCPFEDVHWSLKARPVRMAGKIPMKLCKNCFAYVEPQKTVCPFCGTEFPRFEAAIPAETNAELMMRQSEPDALKADYFWRNVTLAKQKGFKPGFSSALYKDHYGVWPPDEWKEKVKADFAQDAAWQASLKRRLERNAKRDEREKRENAAMAKKADASPSPPAPEASALESALEQTTAAMDADDGESFGDWLGQQGIGSGGS